VQRVHQLAQVVQGRPGGWCTRRTGCRVKRLGEDHSVCAICLELEQDQASLAHRIKGLGGKPRRRAPGTPLGWTQPAAPPDPAHCGPDPLPPDPQLEPAAAGPLADLEARLRQSELAHARMGCYTAAEGLLCGGWGWVGRWRGPNQKGVQGSPLGLAFWALDAHKRRLVVLQLQANRTDVVVLAPSHHPAAGGALRQLPARARADAVGQHRGRHRLGHRRLAGVLQIARMQYGRWGS